VLDVDVEKERISLGIKQLQGDPMETAGELKKGAVVTCEVTEVKEAGLDVNIVGTDLNSFIKRSELARDRSEQRPERFAVGQKVDARVTQFDRRSRKVAVSIKALEVAEEKEAIAQYGSSDSGATLGDILGSVLRRATEKPEPGKAAKGDTDEAAESEDTSAQGDESEKPAKPAKPAKAEPAGSQE
jgi:small subunit ribosomal protein S1